MATIVGNGYLTPDEYLRPERANEYRREYYLGAMCAMSGAGRSHNLITGNLAAAISMGLRDHPAETHATAMRVFIPGPGLYTYPDVVVVRDNPAFADEVLDTLLNPAVLIEVLSPSTESYDRGWKAEQYRGVPSLEEYVLVAQDRPRIEVHRRDGDRWSHRDFAGLEGALILESIGVTIPMADVYRRVAFPEAPPSARPPAQPIAGG